MNIELVLEVDINDYPIKLRPRSDFYENDILHRSSALLLFNNNNELLLQKRSHEKKWFPGMYDFSAAGVVNDESYQDCMTRELKEELGIDAKVRALFKITPQEKGDRAFHMVFIAKTNQDLFPSVEEVSEIKWIVIDDLKQDILDNSHKFTPQLLCGLEKYFSLK